MIFPKPVRKEKERRPMNQIGPVGKRRLALVAELKAIAAQEGWLDRCELAPVLRNWGISFARCSGPLTFCHSTKTSKRGKDPVLDREVCRGCTGHHYFSADLLAPEKTLAVVKEAIRRRIK